MNLFTELKRRNVFRVGTAYLVVAWLVIQVVNNIGDMLELPSVVGRIVLLLLAIGFPIALVISWVYEVTPQGIATQDEVDAGLTSTSGRKLNAVIITGMALAIVLLVMDNYVLDTPQVPSAIEAASIQPIDSEPVASVELEKTLAVLPFTNLSSDPEQEYFSDGLAEELLNQLAQVQELRVAARTSSFYYKGRNEDMRTIGNQLGVNFILEGSVRRAGDTVRISTQLIQADDGFNLWSESFERSMDDIFAVQDEIAAEVTRALSISLGAGEFDLPGATRNVAAWDEFLQGLAGVNEFTYTSLLDAIDHLQSAVTLDPGFGRGWFSLSIAYQNAASLSESGQNADFPRLMDEAYTQARQLAPDMPAIINQNLQTLMQQGRWLEAEQEYVQRLTEFGSSDQFINYGYGLFLANVGRVSDAIPYYQRALRINPRNINSLSQLIGALGVESRFDEAERLTQEWLAKDGGLQSVILFFYWTNVVYLNDPALLREKIESFFSDPANRERYLVPEDIMDRILTLVETEDRDYAMSEARRMLVDDSINNFARTHLRWVAQRHQDMELYQLTTGNFNNGGYRWSPMTVAFRLTEAFKDAMREQGLVDYWRASGNWGDYCRPLEGNDDFECN